MENLKIIFMGTPEFAVPSLEILVTNQYNVVAVITAPDKPQGRGRKIAYSPVKEAALKYNIPVLQPEKLKAPEFLEQLKSYGANLQIVVAFRMLPEVVWAMPKIGTFNLHASLLPNYRGAAPINWAIMNGEKETGVTTFFLQHEIDTGEIIFQEKVNISENETAGELHDKLMLVGADLVIKTLDAIKENTVITSPQKDNCNLKLAYKIFKPTCKIDWNKTASEIHNHIRGLSPYPTAFFEITHKESNKKITLKVFKTTKLIIHHTEKIG